MTEARLDDLLDELVAPFETRPDGWTDVLTRARRTRRRYAVAAAAAVALLIVPAVALSGEIASLFQGTPAPPAVSTSFETANRVADMATKNGFADRFPHADVSQAHGVLQVQTSDGPEDLWAAPNEQGGNCWWIDFANDPPVNDEQPGFGACDTKNSGGIEPGITWVYDHPALSTLFGMVHVQADRVVVQLEDGSRLSLPVVEGAFLASLDKGARLGTVTAYDGDEQVASWESPVG
jgi:hypothetical protein